MRTIKILKKNVLKKVDASNFEKASDYLDEFENHFSMAIDALRKAIGEIKSDKDMTSDQADTLDDYRADIHNELDLFNNLYRTLDR